MRTGNEPTGHLAEPVLFRLERAVPCVAPCARCALHLRTGDPE